MSREYPREWFKASKWGDEPYAKTFDRETEHRLFWNDGRRQLAQSKATNYYRWYPTREEAQAVIDERKANEAERIRMNRIREAAPELLAAAERALNFITNTEGEMGEALESGDMLRAAIAKARGEAA